MAIRTVLVTTRSAVRSHRRAGRPDLARQSVVRGLMLLEDLGRTKELQNGAAEALGEARRELRSLGEAP